MCPAYTQDITVAGNAYGWDARLYRQPCVPQNDTDQDIEIVDCLSSILCM